MSQRPRAVVEDDVEQGIEMDRLLLEVLLDLRELVTRQLALMPQDAPSP